MREEKYTWRIHWGQTRRSHGSDLALRWVGYPEPMTLDEAWEISKKLVQERVKVPIKELHWFWLSPDGPQGDISWRDVDNMRYGWDKDKAHTYGNYDWEEQK